MTSPLTLTGLTLSAGPASTRLPWSHARCLAEAIHQALERGGQVATCGWVVSFERRPERVIIDGRRFGLPLVRLTRGQAGEICERLARVERVRVAA